MNQRSDQPATPRRTLRLSTLLTQLKEEAVVDPATVAPAPVDDSAHAAASPTAASTVPPNVAAVTAQRHWRRPRRPRPRSNITIAEILDRTRQASIGFAATLIALISIPFFGLSTPFGLAIALTGAQMALGHESVELRKLELDLLQARVREKLAASGLDRLRRLCGLGIVLQGLGLALPLPIPGSNMLFIVPILMYGIALLEADGLLIMVCHTITVTEALLAVWFWKIVSHEAYGALGHVAHWIGL